MHTRGGDLLENKLLKRVEEVPIKDVVWRLKNKTRALCNTYDDDYTYCTAFALLLVNKNPDISAVSLQEFLEEIKIESEISQFVIENIEKDWDKLRTILIKDFTYDEFLAYMLFGDEENSKGTNFATTSRSLSALGIRLLEINEDDNVLDLCSGQGTFLMHAIANNSQAKYTGIEAYHKSVIISKMKSIVSPGNVNFILKNALNIDSDIKYDKIFSQYPVNMPVPEFVFNEGQLLKQYGDLLNASRKKTTNWLFNLSIVSLLSEQGKGIGLMVPGSSSNIFEKPFRKYFVDNGLVEAIISLPAGLDPTISIRFDLIVFSHNNNEVTFVDARDIYKKTGKRKGSTLTEENISEIVSLLRYGGDKAVSIPIDKIAENDYILNPARYIYPSIEINLENAVPFESLIKFVGRGTVIKNELLEEYASMQETNIQYIPLSCIRNNVFEPDDMPQYLNTIPDKMENFIIKNNMLLITRAGNTIRTAIANVEEGKTYIGSGNYYLIELDEAKINPYYLQAFFMSDLGCALLDSAVSTGSIIKTIQMPQLKSLPIPIVSLEEQKIIADKCLAAADEYVYYKNKMQKLQDRMKFIYGGE